jgi:hypothetical protein
MSLAQMEFTILREVFNIACGQNLEECISRSISTCEQLLDIVAPEDYEWFNIQSESMEGPSMTQPTASHNQQAILLAPSDSDISPANTPVVVSPLPSRSTILLTTSTLPTFQQSLELSRPHSAEPDISDVDMLSLGHSPQPVSPLQHQFVDEDETMEDEGQSEAPYSQEEDQSMQEDVPHAFERAEEQDAGHLDDSSLDGNTITLGPGHSSTLNLDQPLSNQREELPQIPEDAALKVLASIAGDLASRLHQPSSKRTWEDTSFESSTEGYNNRDDLEGNTSKQTHYMRPPPSKKAKRQASLAPATDKSDHLHRASRQGTRIPAPEAQEHIPKSPTSTNLDTDHPSTLGKSRKKQPKCINLLALEPSPWTLPSKWKPKTVIDLTLDDDNKGKLGKGTPLVDTLRLLTYQG